MKILRNYNHKQVSTLEIPLEIFSAGLSCQALGVLTYLYGMAANQLYLQQGLNILAERLEITQEEVKHCLEELEFRGFIQVSPIPEQQVFLTLPERAG
ncbi:hypothetical protein [Helicobacter suis]|uniref:hypothetical protein n=1 Tax=Helicobacter suis TaxID=104628 RepID=UPI0013D354C1|nr:hypothetical protein [Helicobacter suis]